MWYNKSIEKGAENHMADETRIQVLKEPEGNPETDSFMWLLAIWILHNLVYAKNTVIDTIGIVK